MAKSVRDINQRYWRCKSMPYLSIRSTFNSTQCYKAHSHPELSIGMIESGSTCLNMAGKQVVLQENDIILIAPNLVHSCNPVDGIARSYYMLYIDHAWCCDVLSTLYGKQVTQFTCDPKPLLQTQAGIKLCDLASALSHQASSQFVMKMDSYLLNILSHYCIPKNKRENDNGLASLVKQQLLADIVFPPSLDMIAQQFGRSTESLIRHFKTRFGITPKSFLNNFRIEKAKCLLKAGKPIVEVAMDVGFSDQSQFHRAFVNYTASTPRQYQQVVSIFDNNSLS